MNTKQGSVKTILLVFFGIVALSYFEITVSVFKEAPLVGPVFKLFFNFFTS